jgi:cation:H+ antiporter
MAVALLVIALVIILASAELFTNGVEWFGRRYELGEGAVGSVLAAVGTALPETLIPIIAIVFTSTAASDEIGVGAILGAPFMLATLAMVVTATAVVVFAWRGRRTREVTINEGVMRRDLSHFLIAYGLAMAAGIVGNQAAHYVLAACLLVFYGYYVWETLRAEGDLGGDTKPLYFHRHPEMPHRHRIFLQLGLALVGIVIGAEIFVREVEVLSETLGVAPLIMSLLITPIATELPEKFNSVLWIRQRKDTLALGNITGAMVFQSTFPVSVGLLFTTWQLDRPSMVAGVLALVSGTVFYVALRVRHTLTWWSLAGAGSVYFAYLVYVFTLA